ncbi:MAG: hypothetical protein COA79_12655 [Planctomycetota bacterium]|nr:MAG: hypothetical protein COA79_12655 [Planctomycetota bacterium]
MVKMISIVVMILIVCSCLNILAKEKVPFLLLDKAPHAYFSEKEVSLVWVKQSNFPKKYSSLEIRLVYAGRTIKMKRIASGDPIEFKFKLAGLKEGIVAKTKISLSILDEDDQQLRTMTETIYLFASTMSSEYQARLKKINVGVYAEKDGDIKMFLEASGIPFQKVDEISDFKGKWLLVAGIDFEDMEGFDKELLTLMDKGVSVLILATEMKGLFTIPDASGRLEFLGRDCIKRYEKLLNDLYWAKNKKMVKSKGLLKPLDDTVGIEFSSTNKGWSWIEYRKKKARLIFCGWDLLGTYQESPLASYFLLKVLTNKSK